MVLLNAGLSVALTKLKKGSSHMPILTWKDSFSIGVSQIDDEHKILIGMINKAYDSVVEKTEESVLIELVKEMKAYATLHFATEESLMKDFNYPNTENHKSAHDDFTIKTAAIETMLENGKKTHPSEVLKFLADWLNSHILFTDKQLGDFLNKQGVY